MSDLLAGQLIVNTRPLHQQQGLTDGLRGEGAEVLQCPAIEIAAAPQTAMHRQLGGNLTDYSILVFVSANAVDYAFRFLQPDEIPRQAKIAAIGAGTQGGDQQPVGHVSPLAGLLLAPVYLLVLTPFGLLARRGERDALRRMLDPKAATYWKTRDVEAQRASLDKPY